MKSIYDLWLDCLHGKSSATKLQLVQRYGSSCQVYDKKQELQLNGDLSRAQQIQKVMEKQSIFSVAWTDAAYPPLLREISNPPFCLYYKGDLSIIFGPSVAVVGARKASAYGKWTAEQLGMQLAGDGICVVSGLAAGIDACAHTGALKQGGKTAAVLGCGVDICYPTVNYNLMQEIEKHGVILSEYFPGTAPRAYQFPMRNRIISGLCCGTVVVEAGISSGSLITAELAEEQGREVLAVPGNINQMNSMGSNKLIQDGVYPVVTLQDVAEHLGLRGNYIEDKMIQAMGSEELELYHILLREGEVSFQQLAMQSGKPMKKISSLVTILEMKGIFQTSFGKIFIAKS